MPQKLIWEEGCARKFLLGKEPSSWEIGWCRDHCLTTSRESSQPWTSDSCLHALRGSFQVEAPTVLSRAGRGKWDSTPLQAVAGGSGGDSRGCSCTDLPQTLMVSEEKEQEESRSRKACLTVHLGNPSESSLKWP